MDPQLPANLILSSLNRKTARLLAILKESIPFTHFGRENEIIILLATALEKQGEYLKQLSQRVLLGSELTEAEIKHLKEFKFFLEKLESLLESGKIE